MKIKLVILGALIGATLLVWVTQRDSLVPRNGSVCLAEPGRPYVFEYLAASWSRPVPWEVSLPQGVAAAYVGETQWCGFHGLRPLWLCRCVVFNTGVQEVE